jgi:hypothetical protein
VQRFGILKHEYKNSQNALPNAKRTAFNKGIKLDVCSTIKKASKLKDHFTAKLCKCFASFPHLISFQKRFVKMKQSLSGFSGKAVERTFHALEQHKEINIKQNGERVS